MKDEEFLEKLIGLAGVHGYKRFNYQAFDSVVSISTEERTDYELQFKKINGDNFSDDYWNINLERIIFDFNFIEALLKAERKILRERKVYSYIAGDSVHQFMVETVLKELVLATDRVNFLKETFSDLVEGE